MPNFLTRAFHSAPSLSEWTSDENLRLWINCRPPLETYSTQFLDDMQEFVDGLDLYNSNRAEPDRAMLLVARDTDARIRDCDMDDLGSTRVSGKFALRHRGREFQGEYFFDNFAYVYGLYFRPQKIFQKTGAFYFGYTPRNDVGDYLDWLLDRNRLSLKPGPQP